MWLQLLYNMNSAFLTTELENDSGCSKADSGKPQTMQRIWNRDKIGFEIQDRQDKDKLFPFMVYFAIPRRTGAVTMPKAKRSQLNIISTGLQTQANNTNNVFSMDLCINEFSMYLVVCKPRRTTQTIVFSMIDLIPTPAPRITSLRLRLATMAFEAHRPTIKA